MPPRRLSFYFENRRLEGEAGDSVAKALFRAGIRTLSYSVKYKRPRSLHCGRGRCVMCHMEVDGIAGVPTCITPLREGMRIRRENFQPPYAPLLVAAARVIPFPAGFYYRMFTKPAALRRAFMETLRRMAGVGRVTDAPRADVTAPADDRPPSPLAGLQSTYDVIVVGAGLSGMTHALAAAEEGATVLLVDEYERPGGHARGYQVDRELRSTRDGLIERTLAHPHINWCPRTTAQAFYETGVILLGPGGGVTEAAALPDGTIDRAVARGLRRVQGRSFVFATGAYDVVPLFENNDLAGVFGPRALRLFLERDGLELGRRAVVYGSGRALRDTIALLERHDIVIASVVTPQADAHNDGASRGGDETRPEPSEGNERGGTSLRWLHGTVECAAGRQWLQSVSVQGIGNGTRLDVGCDLLCAAFKGQGAYELAYQAGFRFVMSAAPTIHDRVMVPTQRQVTTSGGIPCRVAGELAGQDAWRDKLHVDGPVGPPPASHVVSIEEG